MGDMADQRGRVLLADPRGYCAGVDRAVVAVERALEIHGAPVYVRKQIVHNKHVVAADAEVAAARSNAESRKPGGVTVTGSMSSSNVARPGSSSPRRPVNSSSPRATSTAYCC